MAGVKTRRSKPSRAIARKAPPAGRGGTSAATVERTLGEVERLLAHSTPQQEIARKLGLPLRTVADYCARARRTWAEHNAATRPELLAEALQRVEVLAQRLKGAPRVSAERLRAELLGLVGSGPAVVNNVAVGVQVAGRGPDLSQWTPEEIAAYDAKLDELEAIEVAVEARLRGGAPAALPGPTNEGSAP